MSAARVAGWLTALLLWGCSAEKPNTDWPEASPALWEVTSADGDKGWLFGTVHALPDGMQWRTATLDSSLAEADLLVVEITNLGDAAAAQTAFENVAYTKGLGPFWGRWGYQFDTRVEQLVGSTDSILPTDIEDWAAALQIAAMVREGNPANGVDRALLASAMPRLGLETYASQFAVFDGLAAEDQKQFLDAVVLEGSAVDTPALDIAWLTGDLTTLEEMGDAAILADDELRTALLTRRNQRFVDQIAPLIDSGREPFVAVGAAHMLSHDGLPALLAARGYAVKRIQ